MRIKNIQLSWFRGAADLISLDTDSKSMVIYGENGSGKSSFVDSIEYILNNGRINHLAHEYSGKHQEKAVHNTHKPQDQKTEFMIEFKDNSVLKTEVNQNGTSKSTGAEAIAMHTWNYRRTVLRQDEVAAFVHGTKGDKYSALLPLLGLDELVITSENFRQLVKSIEGVSKIKDAKALIKVAEKKRTEIFNTASNDQILESINNLYKKYCSPIDKTIDPVSQCTEIGKAINIRSGQVSTDFERFRLLHKIGELKLKENIKDVRIANSKMAGTVEPLIIEKLEVLESAGTFADKLDIERNVLCPACGQSIDVESLKAHVNFEKNRLQVIININNDRRTAIESLVDSLKSLKSDLIRKEVKFLQEIQANKDLTNNFSYINDLNIETLRTSCDEENLVKFEKLLLPVIAAAASATQNTPPDAQELIADKSMVDGAKMVVEAMEQALYAQHVDALMAFISSLEQSTRGEIRTLTEKVIKEISIDIQEMWGILHPGNNISKVNLYIPPDEDKAIDISLEFYGIEQPSPRISLSEGYRNSLGLSIFLSMAKRESDKDRPLFLDDVIVSLDRNHRGMVAELLKKEFSDRQVIMFTHDRDWYSELRHQLDEKDWKFRTLLPYETPDIGMRWSHKTTTFDDARIHLIDRPDSAGNDARKIMDIEFALIAEQLGISFPYLRAEKNDRRMAHDFLERIIYAGKKCLETKVSGSYIIYKEGIEALVSADQLIVSWGNRSSHSFDLVRPEAEKLINSCEKALDAFKCVTCGKNLWFCKASGSEWVQCQCGELRWRYGKAN